MTEVLRKCKQGSAVAQSRESCKGFAPLMCRQLPRSALERWNRQPEGETADPLVDPFRAGNPDGWRCIGPPLGCATPPGAWSQPQLAPAAAVPVRRRKRLEHEHGMDGGRRCNPLVSASVIVRLELEYLAGDDGQIGGRCSVNG